MILPSPEKVILALPELQENSIQAQVGEEDHEWRLRLHLRAARPRW